MTSLESFFAMGGYGGFVWPAYVLSAAVLVGFLWQSLRILRRHEAELKSAEAAGDDIRSQRRARRAGRSEG